MLRCASHKLVGSVKLAGVRTIHTTNTSLAIPHSDLTYRALLRNLRLLKGLREVEKFDVAITGIAAEDVAKQMIDTEPTINFKVLGDSKSADMAALAKLRGAQLHSVIITQPYHTLDSTEHFKTIHECLHKEEGTLGMVWHRAAEKDCQDVFPLTEKQSVNRFRPMKEGESPMQWVESLDVAQWNYKPFKHRKFVDVVKGDTAYLLPFAAACRDFLPAKHNNNGVFQLHFDLHAFHTSVVPQLR